MFFDCHLNIDGCVSSQKRPLRWEATSVLKGYLVKNVFEWESLSSERYVYTGMNLTLDFRNTNSAPLVDYFLKCRVCYWQIGYKKVHSFMTTSRRIKWNHFYFRHYHKRFTPTHPRRAEELLRAAEHHLRAMAMRKSEERERGNALPKWNEVEEEKVESSLPPNTECQRAHSYFIIFWSYHTLLM